MYSWDYSYRSSELNRTIYLAQSSHHPPYSVTLGNKGETIFPVPTRAQISYDTQTANWPNLANPLYPTFVVYLTTIGGRLEF